MPIQSQRSTAAIIALAVAFVTAGCGRSEQAASRQGETSALTVRIAQAHPLVIRDTIRVTGTLFADEEVVLSATVSGRMLTIEKDLGDRLASGDVLATIDPTDYELAVQEREMAMHATLARLNLTDFPEGTFDPAAVPTVRSAALQLANAQARYQRLKQLFEQQPPLISEQEYQDALTAFEVAQSQLEVQTLEARALIAEARTRQAELHTARQSLADTRVAAPADRSDVSRQFVVSERMTAVGAYVSQGTPLFRLIDDDPIKMRALVPERHMSAVELNLPADVVVQAYPEPFRGRISRISPQIDAANRTFPVEVTIANADGRLKPGAFAHADIELPVDRKVVTVPAAAVTSFAGVNKVFVLRDGKAVEIRVRLGLRNEDTQTIQVTQGLAGDEQVILSPPATLVTDTPVQVDAAPAQARVP
jgi:RND family efflux transporter MFP subunit